MEPHNYQTGNRKKEVPGDPGRRRAGQADERDRLLHISSEIAKRH